VTDFVVHRIAPREGLSVLPEVDKHIAEYRRKAEECFDQAKRSSGPEKALFLSLAETWAKMAQQSKTLPSITLPKLELGSGPIRVEETR
jgi:hypothetical protein